MSTGTYDISADSGVNVCKLNLTTKQKTTN